MQIKMPMLKDLMLEKIFYQKAKSKIIKIKKLTKQWFWYETIQIIRKLTTGQGKDYTTGCLLDYHYIKNHYRIIAVYLRRQKELDPDPKAIQKTEFVRQLKNIDGINVDETQNMFVLAILEKV